MVLPDCGRRRMPRRALLMAGFVVLAFLLTDGLRPAHALPRYTAQYGQSCILCHSNPTGGGMRSLYASQYIVPEEIAARGWTEEESEIQSPQISPNLTVGADLRTLAYQTEGGNGSTIAMQGDVYLEAALGTASMIYVEQGINGTGEVFGLTRFSLLDGYAKAGRFLPDHGWRFADHQMFNRRYLLSAEGSDSPRSLIQPGFEVGISPGPILVTASLQGNSRQHGDNYAGRVLLRKSLGALNLGAGTSMVRRQLLDGHARNSGLFGYLAWGPATWLGQVDETNLLGRTGRLVAHELTFAVRPGQDLRLTYNYQDPDIDLITGARRRYGVGVAHMPTPYWSLLLMGNYWDTQPGELVAENDHYEGQLVVHWFY